MVLCWEHFPKLQGDCNKDSKEEFQLHGRQGGTDQEIRPRVSAEIPATVGLESAGIQE